MTKLMEKLGLLGGGVVISLFGLLYMAIPMSEGYADDPFGFSGGDVDVKCGSVLSRDVSADFEDFGEQLDYDEELFSFGEPRIFEGQTASEVCDDQLGSARTVGIVAIVIGAGVFGYGLMKRSKEQQAALARSRSAPTPPAPSAPVASPSPPLAPVAPPNPPTPARSVDLVDATIVRPRHAASVVLPDGTAVALDRPVVVGRDPSVPAHLVGSRAQPLVDPSMLISKTHAAIGVDDGVAWVEDLGSTNGVELVAPDGNARAVPPHRRMPLAIGETVLVGDVRLSVRER